MAWDNVNVEDTAFVTAVTAVPEPSTNALIIGSLVLGVAVLRRRRQARA